MSIYQDTLDRLQPLQPLPTSLSPRIQAFPACKAMMFDIYGTLLISASGDIGHQDMGVDAMEQALRPLSSLASPLDPQHALTRYKQHIEQAHASLKKRGVAYPEIDIVEIWRDLLGEFQAETECSALSQHEIRHTAFAFECNINPVWPMPHFKPTLQRLLESDVYLGIVSNAQFYTPILVNFFLGHPEDDSDQIKGFEANLVYFSWQLSRAKPDTRAFSQAVKHLAKLDIQPSEVLFVGNDRLKDIYPAHRVGMKTCLFAGDQRSLRLREDDERVQGLEPDFIIDDLQQLLDIVLS
jgi:putative hydrolase of the HAD superfamily